MDAQKLLTLSVYDVLRSKVINNPEVFPSALASSTLICPYASRGAEGCVGESDESQSTELSKQMQMNKPDTSK